MARESLILICVFVVLTQLIVVSFSAKKDEIDFKTLHDELKKMGASLRKKCLAENTGVTIEMLDAAEMGQFAEELSCYFKCVMEKGGVMKKDGKINFKILAMIFPSTFKQIVDELLDVCRTVESSDKCDKAMKFNQCMYDANPVAYFTL